MVRALASLAVAVLAALQSVLATAPLGADQISTCPAECFCLSKSEVSSERAPPRNKVQSFLEPT